MLTQEFEDHFDDEIDFTPPAEDTPSMQSPAEVYTLAVSPVALPGPPHLQPPARIAGRTQTNLYCVSKHVDLQTRAHIHIIHLVQTHTNDTTIMFLNGWIFVIVFLSLCCLRCHIGVLKLKFWIYRPFNPKCLGKYMKCWCVFCASSHCHVPFITHAVTGTLSFHKKNTSDWDLNKPVLPDIIQVCFVKSL